MTGCASRNSGGNDEDEYMYEHDTCRSDQQSGARIYTRCCRIAF